MKKIIIMLLCICFVLLTACQGEERGYTETISQVQSSQTTDDTRADIDLFQKTLIDYLNDCWGYREDIHKFIFDKTIELQGIEYYAFKIFSSEDEYLSSFAISLDEKKVYLLNEKGEWVEDINPEPWDKW